VDITQEGKMSSSSSSSSSDSEEEHDSPSEIQSNSASTNSKNNAPPNKKHTLLVKRLRKALSKQAKLAKKYEAQKTIREIKLCKEKQYTARLAKAETKLIALKALSSKDIVRFVLSTDTTVCPLPLVQKLANFKGVQHALKELHERPIREEQRVEREKQRLKQEEEAAKKKLQRLAYEFGCDRCTARFATEEFRKIHMQKRHRTTGDEQMDKQLGLAKKKNRPGQRDRKKAFLEAGGVDKTESREELHPSWEAKRRRKDLSFQGQAQEFQDDDDNN
jgi:hypothetical protein